MKKNCLDKKRILAVIELIQAHYTENTENWKMFKILIKQIKNGDYDKTIGGKK